MMTRDEKITYMDIAMRISGFNFHKKDLALVVDMYDQILIHKGEFTLTETLTVKANVDKEFNPENTTSHEQTDK